MDDKSLRGRVAVITGASRGLGKAMALELAAEGAALVLVSRDREKLEETAALAARAGAAAEIYVADVTDEQQVAELHQQVAARFSHVDILINNAGVNVHKPVVEYSMDEWRKVID